MFYRVSYCYPKEMYLSSNIFEIENQSIKQTNLFSHDVVRCCLGVPYIAHMGTDTFECTSIAACSCLTAAKHVCTFHVTFASKQALPKGLELSCACCVNLAWNKQMVSTTAETSRRLRF